LHTPQFKRLYKCGSIAESVGGMNAFEPDSALRAGIFKA
jgi:hypothetical protein